MSPRSWTWRQLEQDDARSNAELHTLTESLLKESDRAIGVLGGELVSQRIAALLRSYCRNDPTSIKRFVEPLFTGFGPLATFAARIQMAYALGIIAEQDRVQLDLIRKIRNDFAHSAEAIDFGEPQMLERLEVLAGASDSGRDADRERQLVGQMVITKRQFVDRLAFAMVIARAITRLHFCRSIIMAGGDIREYNTVADAKGAADDAG